MTRHGRSSTARFPSSRSTPCSKGSRCSRCRRSWRSRTTSAASTSPRLGAQRPCGASTSPRARWQSRARAFRPPRRKDAMGQLILRRFLQAIPLIFLVSVAAFSLTWLLPGDPAYAIAGIDATPEEAAAVRVRLNLEDPAPVRYVRWLGNAVHGDFGKSVLTDRPVTAELKRRLPITASIAIVAFIMAVLIGTLIGIVQGAFESRLPDKVLLFFVSLGLSTPQFWIATLLITYFGVKWKL